MTCALRVGFGRRRIGDGCAEHDGGRRARHRWFADDRGGHRRNRWQRREEAWQQRRIGARITGHPALGGPGARGVHRARPRLVRNGLAAGGGRRRMRGSTAGRHRRGNDSGDLQEQDDERARGEGPAKHGHGACTIFPRELRRTQALTRSVKPSPASGSRTSGLSGILATSWFARARRVPA